ncbi:MAG: NAD-dependent epimerase/dehydratase family protein [Pseudolysinimonas sp.]
MMRSLVVGGNGFLGCRLVDRLAASGDEVTVFDRFSSGLPGFSPAPNIRMIAGDFADCPDLAPAVAGQDRVFHFLSTTSPAIVHDKIETDLLTNVAPTLALLEACVAAEVRTFYFASSGGAVYGDSTATLHSESDALRPVSPYGIGKVSIENYLRYFQRQFGLQSIVLRIANAYGPGRFSDRGQGFIPIALRRISRGEPVTQYGDGSMVRDYIYIDDLIDMVIRIADASPQHRVYNLGSGNGRSVREVIECISRVTGRDVELQIGSAPIPPIDRVVLDTERFKREFGARTLTDFDAGVRAMWTDLVPAR